ncbi:hypothetical protein GCM10025751_28500 [Haladaptatus pallidirubidus]|uniref:Uncharacterized protein n=2 Tax=Haladaptatus pallidirubidus TaxID=1008152 RepID=A0AAV3UIN4_9EURY
MPRLNDAELIEQPRRDLVAPTETTSDAVQMLDATTKYFDWGFVVVEVVIVGSAVAMVVLAIEIVCVSMLVLVVVGVSSLLSNPIPPRQPAKMFGYGANILSALEKPVPPSSGMRVHIRWSSSLVKSLISQLQRRKWATIVNTLNTTF